MKCIDCKINESTQDDILCPGCFERRSVIEKAKLHGFLKPNARRHKPKHPDVFQADRDYNGGYV